MNCAECKELLVGFLEGLVDEAEKKRISEHVKSCANCSAELEKLEKLHKSLISNGEALAESDLEAEVFNRILREQKEKLKTAGQAGKTINFWRIIMKSPIIKLAAAAVIIAAVIVGVTPFLGGTVTFADVIEPILNARTVVLDLVVGSEETGLVVHDIVVGSKIRRTIPNMGLAIIDLDNARALRLDPSEKSAVYVDIQGPIQQYMNSYLGMVRDIVADMENHPEWPVQELGQRWMNGQSAVGFLLSVPNIKLTIWADAETAAPIRIEMLMGQSQTIIKNIEFDVPVDESLVSMDIPDGYTLHEGELDYTDFDEQDFIIILQFWAEHVLGGNFPDSVSAKDILKMRPALRQKIDQLNISDEEKMQIGAAMGRGFIFFRQLEFSDTDWHYVGKGVELGDANTAVFLYRPEGSEYYRVMFGDLHIEEVAPENLPQ
jgi:predicted anti-sigma-YlaC factor YlaD